MSKARLTQRLANTYPLWSEVRSNDQSVGQQFLNALGLNLDKLHKEVLRGVASFWLPSTPISEVDLFYQYKLPKSYEFTTEDDDVTEYRFETPVVSGYISGVARPVALAANNDMDGFWYQAIPSRVSIEEETDASYLVASGFISSSYITPLLPSGEITIPNRLGIKITGGTSYLDYEEGVIRQGLVQIEGQTRQGLDTTEVIPFLHDDLLYTTNDFATVSGIYANGIDPSTSEIYVTAAEFQNPPYKNVYPLDYAETGEKVPSFYTVESGLVAGETKLNLQFFEEPALDLRVMGFSDLYTAFSQEFTNQAGAAVNVVDVALEPFTDWLWAVDQSKLYLYKTELPYIDGRNLHNKTGGCASKLEISDEYITPGESVTVSYIWKRPTRSVMRHRVYVTDPAGSIWTIVDGILTPFTPTLDFWVYNGELRDRHLRKDDTFTLTTAGQYTYSLEVQYSDGVYEVDKRIVYVVQIAPVAEYNLSSLGIVGDITGVDVDSEGYLWVVNNLGRRYKLGRHFDLMLIDYNKKIIYFRENYDTIRVIT